GLELVTLRGRAHTAILAGHRWTRPEELVEVTGHAMTRGDLGELRLLRGAAQHGKRTARMEVASSRRVERAGDLARQHDLVPRLVRMRGQRRREQGLGVRMERCATQL